MRGWLRAALRRMYGNLGRLDPYIELRREMFATHPRLDCVERFAAGAAIWEMQKGGSMVQRNLQNFLSRFTVDRHDHPQSFG